jgi:hypothetical protein
MPKTLRKTAGVSQLMIYLNTSDKDEQLKRFVNWISLANHLESVVQEYQVSRHRPVFLVK